MRVLVACEYSGRVREAFRVKGHHAFSCDIIPSSDNSPNHIQKDVLEVLEYGWDLMIAHPPCTYLSRAGARWLYPKAGQLDNERYEKLLAGREFFMTLLNSDIPKIAVENPTPFKIAKLPKPSQVIQPFQFGDPYSKRTLLWLKGLEPLTPTNEVDVIAPWVQSNTSGFRRGQKHHAGIARSSKERSLTFQGIADAMAEQWGSL